MEVAHTRELERILESSREELENDKEDTKRAIEIMHKVRHWSSKSHGTRGYYTFGSGEVSCLFEERYMNFTCNFSLLYLYQNTISFELVVQSGKVRYL